MEITFNDILNSMKKAFYDESGHNVENVGDINARFHAVASEIYSLYCNLDYSRRQSFVQTAQGEYLDYHAQLRDMQRHNPSKAIGELTFGITEPINVGINIPKGTICSVKDKPYIQFKTDSNAVLKAGEVSVSVPATALEIGDGYNVPIGSVTVLVNAPSRIETVTNLSSFVGGYDGESDESLRKRIIDSFSYSPTGMSRKYTEDNVKNIDGVIDCRIFGIDPVDGSRPRVYVRSNTGKISFDLFGEIEQRLTLLRIINVGFDILIPEILSVDLIIESNADEQEIKTLCREYFDSLRIGESLDLTALRIWLSKRMDDEIVEISSAQSSGQYVICPNEKYISINSIGVIRNG